jgi:hypothetical protein
MDPFVALLQGLQRRAVRYAIIGVWGANYYAQSGAVLFTTLDRDLFLPPDTENLRRAWEACEEAGLELWCGRAPLDQPRDIWLAQRMVTNRALTTALGPDALQVDLILVMDAHEFEAVWSERRTFRDGDAEIHVARLRHIVESKAAADRPKDRLFLATHQENLSQLMRGDESSERK